MQKTVETVVTGASGAPSDPSGHTSNHVGKPIHRVDGQLKVTGQATFSAEFQQPHVAYGALVYSSIARGRIASIDQSAAASAPGVLGIVTHENAPTMNPPLVPSTGGVAASNLPVMQSDEIFWNGQPVAVIIAETQEQADYAASLVRVEYHQEEAALSFDALKSKAELPPTVYGQPPEFNRGDAETELKQALFKSDEVYHTSRYNPSAIELHATIATWEDDETLTVYDSTQSISLLKTTIAQVFDLAPEKVRVLAPFVGGGFGGKLYSYNHTLLCIAAAKQIRRPVKLVLSREGVSRVVGTRAPSEQRAALAATADGRFVSLIHKSIQAEVSHGFHSEPISLRARHLYASESRAHSQKVVHLDTVANTPVRAPGDATASFALESAIDELAYKLKMDPIELRRINEPANDPVSGASFSNRNLIEAYRRGAERFGWKDRHAEPRAQRDGRWLIGQGVATAFHSYIRVPSSARICLYSDETALVQVAAQEMGMGTATVQIQYAAQQLGLPMNQVSFAYGDSNLPHSPMAGGSGQTVSILAAVAKAIEQLHQELLRLVQNDSPLAGATVQDVEARNGGLFRRDTADQGETYASLLQQAGKSHLEIGVETLQPTEFMEYSMHEYGAQFCEVRVNEVTGEVRITRWVGSFDCGRILNPKTARSQLRGAIIMGIGMALAEDTLFDERQGRIVNASLAEYHIPVHLDIPTIDVIFLDIPDEHTPFGAHGIGEIGITGVAAAIANAVFNATGKRIRDLPITLDKLL